ncbi:hypothetical protein TL16_g04795 [Triparma laevis f. inornata]|uniref:Uncharacterized protein n=2 Tax=Triparma laevis TaxID=1534972 RepID=A0A9W7L0A2_9STRA|nr:hypothetical protein TL16_g04795 [Triparma laevis f. inornata]GMI17854.1 hypothetical protein TrLO_g14177 [Triparma laevis f. longispina]
MHTSAFRIHFFDFVPVDALMALRVATKGWNAAVDALIDEGVRSGELIVHDGKDISFKVGRAREERCKLVTRVVFFLNIMKVGEWACRFAVNLVVVEIPEDVESICDFSFRGYTSLTTVSFPTTLSSIRQGAFNNCASLYNVDLLHTNLQELGQAAFGGCKELKSMTIPDSLQTLGDRVFYNCKALVPSNIDVGFDHDVSAIVAYLCSKQSNNNPDSD